MAPRAILSAVSAGIAVVGVCVASADLGVSAADWRFREIVVDDGPVQPARVTDCAICDINGDGAPDLWYSARPGRGTSKRFMPWYKNTGDMQRWVRCLPFEGPSCYGTWGDVDGDGDMDLIADKDRRQELQWMENPLKNGNRKPEKGPWRIWRIEPAGTGDLDPDEVYTFHRDTDSSLHQHLDLNGDGRLDIVICTYGRSAYYIPGPEDPKTLHGNWPRYEIGAAGGTGSLGDIDGDGDVDFAVRNGWYENLGDPTKSPWPFHDYKEEGYRPEGKVELGDIDADGRLDVAVTSEEAADGIVWYRNPGGDSRGRWAKRVIIHHRAGWEGLHSLQLADFDGDRDLDVLTAEMHDRGGRRVAIAENTNGRGTSWSIHVISTVGSHNAKVADLDGDGDPDVAGKNYAGDIKPRIWLNPNGPFEKPATVR